MKKLIYKILFSLSAVFLLGGCSDGLVYEDSDLLKGQIIIDFSSGLELASRNAEDTYVERYLSHLDIIIFKRNNENVWGFDFHQRVEEPLQNDDNSTGTVILNKNRNQFTENALYKVYVIANSTLSSTDFNNSSLTEDNLKNKEQTDINLHLTALNRLSGVSGQNHDTTIPDYFLMDGVAKIDGKSEVELNTGNETEYTTTLNVTLQRAASKIVVKCKPKALDVNFDRMLPNKYADILVKEPMYRIRNLPTLTSILDGGYVKANTEASLKSTVSTAGTYYQWKDDGSVEVTLYVYEHSWNTIDNFSHGTNLVLNIPLKLGDKEYPSNYYQIPLAKPQKDSNNEYICSFGRNKYYEIEAMIASPGAINIEEPVTLESLNFTTMEWTIEPIKVSGSNASYLEVTPTLVEMHNVAVDANTVKFSSSSPVTVAIDNSAEYYPYFIDKFGAKKNVTVNEFNSISGSVSGNLSGNIEIRSSLPENNTIRYFRLVVSNGVETKYVLVKQYPLIYVVNQVGFYSYRQDFGSHYENRGDRYVGISVSFDKNDTPVYSFTRTAGNGFFWSKVVNSTNTNAEGKSNIHNYSWPSNNNKVSSSWRETHNARMYNINISSSSSDYVVGVPRMIEGEGNFKYTDPSEENSVLVSPKFLIASRLGLMSPSSNINTDKRRSAVYNYHCANYVETYRVPETNEVIHLRNWRVPTKAEIDIIIDLQGGQNENADAIDYLLNGQYYFSASGSVFNDQWDKSNSGTFIRCVRDAFDFDKE